MPQEGDRFNVFPEINMEIVPKSQEFPMIFISTFTVGVSDVMLYE